MWNWLKKILSPPVFDDEEKTRVAGVLHIILLAFVILVITRAVVISINLGQYSFVTMGTPMLVAGTYAILYFFMRKGYVHQVSVVFVFVYWIVTTLAIPGTGGIRGPFYSLYVVVVVAVGLFLGGRWVIGFALASIIAGFSIYQLEIRGVLPVELSYLSAESMFYGVTQHIVTASVFIYLYHQGIARAMRQIRSNEQALAQHAERLEAEITERERAEKELQESEARVKEIAANIPGGAVYQFKLDAEGHRSFPYVSAGWYDLVGVTPEEAQTSAEPSFGHILPEDMPEVERTIALSASTLESWHCEFRIQVEDEIKWLLGNAAPKQQPDGILWSGVITNITPQKQIEVEREHLQQEIIEAQKQAIQELSTPVIPIMEGIIVLPMVGTIDSMRVRDVTRSLLAGISRHKARVVILDVTGVSLMDTGIVNHLNKTIQAAQLKGAQAIVTGISDVVAESIVDLGIDWSDITTLSDLQSGLRVALNQLGLALNRA